MENAWLNAENTLVIGHRGASADAPENTLAAFRLAREQGAQGIEFDVRLAADGVPVVIHDPLLDRTTNAEGPVAALSSRELQNVDAGDGEPVPTLDAVFAEMGADFLYNVEIKADPARVRACVLAVLASIERYQLHAQICISTFEHTIMQQVQMLAPRQIVLGMLRAPHSPPHPDWFRGEAVHPHFMLVNEAYLAWASELGCKVNTWTVDSAEVAQLLQQFRVNSIMTNKPAHIIAALN